MQFSAGVTVVHALDGKLDVEELDVEEEHDHDDKGEHDADPDDFVYENTWEGESRVVAYILHMCIS